MQLSGRCSDAGAVVHGEKGAQQVQVEPFEKLVVAVLAVVALHQFVNDLIQVIHIMNGKDAYCQFAFVPALCDDGQWN